MFTKSVYRSTIFKGLFDVAPIFSLYHVYHNDYEARKFTSCMNDLKLEFLTRIGMDGTSDCPWTKKLLPDGLINNAMVLRSPCWRRFPAYFRRECSTFGHWDTAQFKPKKAVILTKVSRYEFEKLRHDTLSESQLEQELTARGSNYAAIRHHHNIHKV